MFKATYIVFLIMHILYNKTTNCIESFYGVRTNEYPKTSCHKIANIETARRCLGTCGTTVDRIVMISLDKSTKTCMCCSDITGSDIIGPNWKSYVPRTFPCSTGFMTNYSTSLQICLKYFSVPARYSSDNTLCQAEGGNLIKFDSQEKFEIFKDYHVPIADNSLIQVWVQGEKVGGQWLFDDGTPIPDFCPISMSNGPGEVHFRAYGSTSFTCVDAPKSRLYHYTCEYHRLLSINT